MAGACGATLAADQAVELKSTDGRKKMVAVGGTSNPTAAAITHVLNNKHHFPLCKGVQDLFKGKRMVEYTNMEKLEMFAGEAIKEAEKRNKLSSSNNNNNAYYNSPTRSSSASATTLSTLSSSC